MKNTVSLIKKIPYALRNPRIAIIYIFSFLLKATSRDPEAIRLYSWKYGKLLRLAINDIFPGIEKIGVTIEKLFDRTIETSIDAYEIVILSAIAKFLNAKNILEIGTWDGNTALNLAVNSPPDAFVATIDLPLAFIKGVSRTKLSIPDNRLNLTKRKMVGIQYKNTIYEKKITQVYGDSAEINWDTLGAPFDLIFIDGCHTYSYVKNDTENALKFLKPKGVIIWHDYGMIEDVSIVVDEIAAKIRTEAIRGTRFAVGFNG